MVYSKREQAKFKKFFTDDLKGIKGKYILHSFRNAATLVTEERMGRDKIQIEIPLHPSILENINDHLSEEEIAKRRPKSLLTQFLFQQNNYITLFRFKPYKIDEEYGFQGEHAYSYSIKDNLIYENYKPVMGLDTLRKGTYFKTYYDAFVVSKYLIDFLSLKSYGYFSNYAEPSAKVIQKNNSLIFVILPKEPVDYNIAY